MDTLFIIIKAIGDFIMAGLVLALGVFTLSKSLTKTARIMEDVVKKSTVLRVSIGLLLVIASTVYLAAVILLQLAQAKQQNPVRQAKQSATALAQQFSGFLREYDTNHNKVTLLHEYMSCRTRLDKVQEEFLKLGVPSPEIDKAKTQIWEVPLEAYNMPVECLRTIISELERLSGGVGP
jgi:hypothetical protein